MFDVSLQISGGARQRLDYSVCIFIDSLIGASFHMFDGSPQALCDHFQIVAESLHMFDDSLHLFDFRMFDDCDWDDDGNGDGDDDGGGDADTCVDYNDRDTKNDDEMTVTVLR